MFNKIKYILFIFIFVILFSPEVSFANVCSKNGYTVLTINGMFTDEDKAKNNLKELKQLFPDLHKNQPLKMDYIMNPSHLAGIGDIFAVAYQKLFDSEEVKDYDLTEMLYDASKKVTTQKLLLVAHSQGNFYANSMYYGIVNQSGGVPAQSIGIYGVASPASHVAGGGKYITSSTDQLINNLRLADILTILPANENIILPKGDTSNGHGFSNIYLKYRGDKIVADIKSSLDKLKNNYDQVADKPCINPPEITLGHKIARLGFTVADPVASGLYAMGVNVRDNTTQVANALFSFSRYIAEAVGSIRTKNNATAVLVDVETSEESNPEQMEAVQEKSQPKKEEITKKEQEEILPQVAEKESIETKIPTRPVFSGGGGSGEKNTEEDVEVGPEVDTTPPDIDILGSEVMTIEVNSIYTDAGATAEDDVDGAITPIVSGAVDTSMAGVYEITYTATDLAGNSEDAIRVVRVDNGAALNGANSISIQDDYAYIVSDDGSLEIVDISNPDSPRHVSYFLNTEMPGGSASIENPKGIAVDGDYAYVIASGALHVFDVSDPFEISLVSQLKNTDLGALKIKCPAVIKVSGDYAYIGSGDCGNSTSGQLDVVDVSDPSSPMFETYVQSTNIPMSNYPRSIFIEDDYLYQVVSRGDYFQIFDISNPSSPQSESLMNDGTDGAVITQPASVFVDGDYAYIASAGANTLQVLDISDPTVPIYKGKLQHGDGGADLSVPLSIFVEDDHAYIISNGSETLEIVNISDPANPVHVGKITDGTDGAELGDARGVVVEGDYAFIVSRSGDTLEVIDISDPANPTHAGKLSHGDF